MRSDARRAPAATHRAQAVSLLHYLVRPLSAPASAAHVSTDVVPMSSAALPLHACKLGTMALSWPRHPQRRYSTARGLARPPEAWRC